jgi:hypothetical protein
MSFPADNLKPPVAEIDQRSVVRGLVAGVLTAIIFGLGGFFLISDRTGAMGGVLFLLLPFASGFATALVARSRNLIIASLLVGAAICSAILILMGMEGWVCMLMSAPLVAVGLTIGAVIGALVRREVIDKSGRPNVMSALLLLMLPLFLTGANKIEEPARRVPRAETFTSVFVSEAPPEKVWNSIKIMDRVNGHKGFLMRIGLPVPVSCAIDREEVGGKRRCNFEHGYIEERIAEWNPPHSMKLEITSWDVPGRPWLDFKDATYELHQENDRTIMTRTTTIVSRLMPAWYWRRFERIGVETEHEYLFQALRKRVDGQE